MAYPQWLRKPAPDRKILESMESLLQGHSLNTVCREANCPNVGECFGNRTATFMILGTICTRNCPFCNVGEGQPGPPHPEEPHRLAEAAAKLGLEHVVVTSVTRDDLEDGGAEQFAQTVDAIRQRLPGATVEVLIPDFGGDIRALEQVLERGPEVLAHNLETVKSLYPRVRPRADYARSLDLLSRVTDRTPHLIRKSGLMLGLGETEEEVLVALQDLKSRGVTVVTLGQYLRPSAAHLPVREFVPPERFIWWQERAYNLGFDFVASGPFVRSSYQAAVAVEALKDGNPKP